MISPWNIRLDDELEHALARQLARHASSWARHAGAANDVQQTFARCVEALGLAMEAGHTCLPLSELASDDALALLRAQLWQSGLVGKPGAAPLPFVLDAEDRFYLYRYYDDERRLAQRLLVLLGGGQPAPATASEDDQQRAIEHALHHRLTVISGGPGTGKTTTVARILAALLGRQSSLRIALAAPTGKAAQRMMEALRERGLPETIRADSLVSCTLHRLLGWRPDDGSFRHGPENPLPYDLVIVDEASMIDLALAARLFDALPHQAQLLLLGDRDQLSAVEKGVVFAELARDDADAPLGQAVVLLRRNYRFAADSGIGQLAQAINAGDEPTTLGLLAAGKDDLCWLEEGTAMLSASRLDALASGYDDFVAKVSAVGTPSEAHRALAGYRILAALRTGPRGVEGLNDEIEKRLRQKLAAPPLASWYAGRAVIVLANDYTLDLYNGDIGIALPDQEGRLQVYFAQGEHWRAIAPTRLPRHASAWAMTVHKAQGSEFGKVAIVLPASSSPILSRELLYTAITRATTRVELIGGSDHIAEAVAHRTRRAGGLHARLQEEAGQTFPAEL